MFCNASAIIPSTESLNCSRINGNRFYPTKQDVLRRRDTLQHGILDKDLDWFKKEKYNILDFDCTKWTDTNRIHKDLKKQLDFPDYYGENMNALNDCLSDLEINETGLVITFRHFQIVDKDLAHSLLDIFARNSRRQNLFGKRLLTLVQVDNLNYQIDPVGSSPVLWNDAEWLDSKRDL